MKKRDNQERELRENTTNFAVLKNWRGDPNSMA